MLKAALVYASWGWHIHPLRPGDKRPLLANWPERATADPDEVRRWWARWPGANIGLACGPSGFVAIDLDVKAGVDGLAAWEALKAELGLDGDASGGRTLASDTPSGGRHLLFALPEGCAVPRNTAGKLGPGIDTRGDGGYIVLPPSRLAGDAEAAWTWRPEAHPRDCRPQPLPRALWERLMAGRTEAAVADSVALDKPATARSATSPGAPTASGGSPGSQRPDRLAGVAPYATAAVRYEALRVGQARWGTRNDTLNTAAFSLGQLVATGWLHRGQVERPLFLAARVAGLGPEEAMATIRSGLDAGLKRPRHRPPKPPPPRPVSLAPQPEPAPSPSPHLPVNAVQSGNAAQPLSEAQPTLNAVQPQVNAVQPLSEAQPKLNAVQPVNAVQPLSEAQPQVNAVQPLSEAQPQLNAVHPQVNAVHPETSTDDGSWMLALPADDEGNAQCVARLHGDRFLYCSAYGWQEYSGSHWAPDPEGLALRATVIEVLKARRRLALQEERSAVAKVTTRSNHRVNAIRSLLSVLLAADVASFDASPDHLNVANGVLDLRSGELAPHRPAQRFTYCLEVPYETGTGYRPWQDWLRGAVAGDSASGAEPPATGKARAQAGGARASSALPGEAEEYYLQLAVGYSLTGHTSEEVLFYLYGPPRSGKGTFTEALLALLGPEPLAAEVHFGTFVRSRNHDTNAADLARLKPCRLLVSSEPNRDDWLNAGELKRLTGGNLIFAALKYRAHFSYRPTYKIWLSGNHPPQADVDDDALWSRLRVIAFPHSHLGREDRGLKARMKGPEMQRQILAWAVDGARAWYRTAPRGLPTPPSIEVATHRARYELDHVGQWLAECVEVTEIDEDFVPNAALQASYDAWARDAGAPACTMTRLTQTLKAKGLAAGVKGWHHGKSQRGCHGVRLSG